MPGMVHMARAALAMEMSRVESTTIAVIARRRPASASSMVVVRWMMHTLSHYLSLGWPRGSGSRSMAAVPPTLDYGRLPVGVVLVA